MSTPDYLAYHDTEWGFPVDDDHRMFEKLCLEGFQSGLSWLTILRKRDDFRRVFHGFDPEQVAVMGEDDVRRLLQDPTIVRHRGKIEATIQNARASLDVIDEWGTLGAFCWSFEPEETLPLLEPTTPESVAMAKELKRQRLPLRRAHHGLCLHGSDGDGQRPRRRMRHPRRGGRGPSPVRPTAATGHCSLNRRRYRHARPTMGLGPHLRRRRAQLAGD